MHNTESSWCNIWSRTNAQLPPAAPLLLSSSSTFCLLKRALILAALVHYYFLSFGTCSDLRRTMCTTFSPLLAKLCVFSQILAALVFYRHYSALLFYSAAASVKDCFSWVRQPFSVHWRQYQYRHYQHRSISAFFKFNHLSSIGFVNLSFSATKFELYLGAE